MSKRQASFDAADSTIISVSASEITPGFAAAPDCEAPAPTPDFSSSAASGTIRAERPALSASVDPNAPPSPSKVASSSTHPFAEGTYCGSWACGRPEGRGTYTSHLGSSFTGVWRRGWANGSGIYHWADGRCDISHYHGEADRLPLLAAVGEGVRWSKDRSKAFLLRNGVETGEEIPRARAEAIADKLIIAPTVPPARGPAVHSAAKVSKRELESLSGSLSKRQRREIDTRLEDEGGASDDALPFEQVWQLLCPK